MTSNDMASSYSSELVNPWNGHGPCQNLTMRIAIDSLARQISGTAPSSINGADTIAGASIDSRALLPGQAFFAIVAERDGHEFVASAFGAGASVAVVEHLVPEVDGLQLVVGDTVAAPTHAGRLARSHLGGPVIGITGSVGKTSTKDMLNAICAKAGVTTASEKSLNNELGVPLTLLNAADDTQRTIVEMGARGIGHIAWLCSIAEPTIAVLTVVGAAHLGEFGSIEAIAAGKSELVASLDAHGVAVLNADDERVLAMKSCCSGEVITYGEAGEVRASGLIVDDQLRTRFDLITPWGEVPVQLNVRGVHQVSNALAAAAAACVSGVTLEQIADGLADSQLSPWRMEVFESLAGGTVINDSYNANPVSMVAALRSLATLDAQRKTAVVGLMAELGPSTADEHRRIAELARSLGIDVIAVGTDLYSVPVFATTEDAIEQLKPPGSDEACLIKASRVAGLEALADAWRA